MGRLVLIQTLHDNHNHSMTTVLPDVPNQNSHSHISASDAAFPWIALSLEEWHIWQLWSRPLSSILLEYINLATMYSVH